MYLRQEQTALLERLRRRSGSLAAIYMGDRLVDFVIAHGIELEFKDCIAPHLA